MNATRSPVVRKVAKPPPKTAPAPAKTMPSKAVARTVPARAPSAAAAPTAPKKPARVKKVHDKFTMPKSDFDLIAACKQRALKLGHKVKKSELLRAGLHKLSTLDNGAFAAAVVAVSRSRA
jgi:hypothetical protein